MKNTLNLNETVKIAKDNDGGTDCRYLYFKLWQKNGKSRVYINDYKKRTLGYIDTATGKVEISDRQGNSEDEVNFAVNSFLESYEIAQ